MSSTTTFARIHRMASRVNLTVTMLTLIVICTGCVPEHSNWVDSGHVGTRSVAHSAPTKLPRKSKSAAYNPVTTSQVQSSRAAANSASSSRRDHSRVAIKQWQYCLASSRAQHLIYISLPFPTGRHAALAFARMLRHVRHDDVQCPIADDEASISAMRERAISLNRNAGSTIVTWEPPQRPQPKSKDIYNGQNLLPSHDVVWQYCLAPSHAEKKVYISPAFPKGTDVDIAFAQMLHRVQHDDIQCPIANDEASITTMRDYAISFNLSVGNTIVDWQPPQFSRSGSVDIHTSKRSPHPGDLAWQYCLAPSYAEKKLYISWPFPKTPSRSSIEGTFGETLSQSKKQHDDVQCPIGKNEQSILSMREHAISFNLDRGYTIITRNWKP